MRRALSGLNVLDVSRLERGIPRLVRAVAGSLSATCWLTSLIVALVVLGYAFLTILRLVPPYEQLLAPLGLPVVWFLSLVYFVVSLALILLWYLMVVRSGSNLTGSQRWWRPIYQLTDRAGLELLDAGLFLTVVIAALWVPMTRIGQYVREGPAFIAFLVAVPTMICHLPWLRPRRYVVRSRDETLLQAAEQISAMSSGGSPDRIADFLMKYNELERRAGYKNKKKRLPFGLVLEIPPRF